jgi:hypothetical protein
MRLAKIELFFGWRGISALTGGRDVGPTNIKKGALAPSIFHLPWYQGAVQISSIPLHHKFRFVPR